MTAETKRITKCITDGQECEACKRGAEHHPTNTKGQEIHGHWVGDSLKAHNWVEA